MESVPESIQFIASFQAKRKRASRLDRMLKARGLASLHDLLYELYERQCLTVRETSDLLNVDPNTICHWINRFSIRKAAAKRRLVFYSLSDVDARRFSRRFSVNEERFEERLISPDQGLLWLLGFALGDGNVGFYMESANPTVAPEFAVFNSEEALIKKSFNIMDRWKLNPLKISYKSSHTYGLQLRKIDEKSPLANFWKVKAQSSLLPASLLVGRDNRRRNATFAVILNTPTWIIPFVQGFFDAEGRVPRGIGRRREVPNVSAFNTDFDLISWVWLMLNRGLEIRTSRIYGTKYHYANRLGVCYTIDITGQWAVHFLERVGFSHPVKSEKGKALLDWNAS